MQNHDNFSMSIEALKRMVAKLKPATATEMKSCVAGLYLAQNNQPFRYANIIGLLQLDVDRKLKTKFLRMYNLESLKLAFEVELYYGFGDCYRRKDDVFHFFDYEMGTIGILYKNKQQADFMMAKIKSQAPLQKELQEYKEEQRRQEEKEAQSKSIFGKLKRKVFGKDEDIKESSQVINITKIASLQIDANGQYKPNGASPVEQQIFKKMNLNIEDEKNAQTLEFMGDELIMYQLKKEARQNPTQEVLAIIQEKEKQEQDFLQDCRQTRLMNLPPPPPPPPILSPANKRISVGKNRSNLLDQIRNNNLKLKSVKTNEKGGVNIDLSNMDSEERDDFAAEMRRKIAMRKKALNKWNNDDDDPEDID